MNPDTGQVYKTTQEIEQARMRGERLVPVSADAAAHHPSAQKLAARMAAWTAQIAALKASHDQVDLERFKGTDVPAGGNRKARRMLESMRRRAAKKASRYA